MKIVWKKLKEDDPIFNQGFVISSHKVQKLDLVTLPKKLSQKEKIIHLTKSLIDLGWKLKGDNDDNN
jgi:hypothetical protein